MMLCRGISLLLCVLLVTHAADGQWNYYYSTRSPARRITPLIGQRIGLRFDFEDSGITAAPVVRTPPPIVARPAAPVTSRPVATYSLPPENDLKISQAVVDFMMRISRTLAQHQSKTELFSPLSISAVANLLYLGSDGVTHQEFGKVLTPPGLNWKLLHQRYGKVLSNLLSSQPIDAKRDQWRRQTCPHDEEDDDYPSTPASRTQVIRVANGIFYQKDLPITPQYVSLAQNIYGALVRPIDPQNSGGAAAMINGWVSDVTAGKIRSLIDGPLSPSTSVVVANALYFKAKWRNQFEPMVTRDAPFFPDGYDGPSYRVKMMSLSGCVPYYRTKEPMEVTIIGLPYRDDTSTMYLIQPTNSSRDGIRRLQATLSGKLLDSWIGQMKLQSATVRLPKMHLRNSVDLLQSFQKLGFNSILSPAKSDLSKMVSKSAAGGQQRPYVNQILHKVDLAIDEEGTEGAAATSALVDRIGTQRNFNGNAPFLIYLRHDATGLPLFYGPIFDPR